MKTAISSFNKLSLTTLVAVYFLIFVGGIVRSTGSGMGCPDWPKCFGRWIPPTSVEQLPSNYKKDYSAIRDRKNKKFASLLNVIGLKEVAQKLMIDKSILVEDDFNATKTWIEYLNRLVGIVIGFLIALLFWRAFKLRKENKLLFLFSSLTLVTVIFQGWFGSIVVSTNLTTWTITIHMLLAFILLFLLILLYWKSKNVVLFAFNFNLTTGLLISCILALLIQVLFGTQVREGIDKISSSMVRQDWISNLGGEFIIHRSFSWLLLLVHVFLILNLRKTSQLNFLSTALMVLILSGIFSGAIMAYFSMPAFIQPVHLLLATLIFGIQILLLFKLNTPRPDLLKN